MRVWRLDPEGALFRVLVVPSEYAQGPGKPSSYVQHLFLSQGGDVADLVKSLRESADQLEDLARTRAP